MKIKILNKFSRWSGRKVNARLTSTANGFIATGRGKIKGCFFFRDEVSIIKQ